MQSVPWFRRLVPCLWPRRTGLDPMPAHVVIILTRDRIFHCDFDSSNAPFVIGGVISSKTECRFTTLKYYSLCFIFRKFNFRSSIWLTLLRRRFVPLIILPTKVIKGTAVTQWLRRCATNRKVTGSIPAGITGIFHWRKILRSHYGPGFDSASNRNECQEHFLGVKAAGAQGWQPYHHPVPLSRNLGTLTSWNSLCLSRPVMGLLYLY